MKIKKLEIKSKIYKKIRVQLKLMIRIQTIHKININMLIRTKFKNYLINHFHSI
jgi:hypothetical protein